MGDYKSAKEAFVSDNPGASIGSINAVSLVALVCSSFSEGFCHLETLINWDGRRHMLSGSPYRRTSVMDS